MGREIRRVPPGWQHPADEHGQPVPLLDADYGSAVADWDRNNHAWQQGTHPDLHQIPAAAQFSYPQWAGPRPDQPDRYRPAWTPEAASAYQLYENVTEGTPVSPVFATADGLGGWLDRQGWPAPIVQVLLDRGRIPTGIGLVIDIDPEAGTVEAALWAPDTPDPWPNPGPDPRDGLR